MLVSLWMGHSIWSSVDGKCPHLGGKHGLEINFSPGGNIPRPSGSDRRELLLEVLAVRSLLRFFTQFLKALHEAETYPGPSLIIAYAPCINHGIKAGMSTTIQEEKFAVESGYWHLYRFNPLLEKEGKNPFQLDSKEPDWTKYMNFLAGEVRYASLKKLFPEAADELFARSLSDAKWRYNSYCKLAGREPTAN